MTDKCPIWGTNCDSSERDLNTGTHIVRNSPRAGGGDYEIDVIGSEVDDLNEEEKARLTSILIEQRRRGNPLPIITTDEVQRAKQNHPLPVSERADRLLIFLSERSSHIGEELDIPGPRITEIYWALGIQVSGNLDFSPFESALAWSESTNETELAILIDDLADQGQITRIAKEYGVSGSYLYMVTTRGHRRIEELETNADASKCFVAMWFDDSMKDARENGFRPAVKAAGYTPSIIDEKPDLIGKIDDAIVAEIRRSRFIVADFTHGTTGARGGVYYEAGFAQGLGLPVIFTCRKDMIDKVHFDTRQFSHIVWENPEDLCKRLTDKIVASIGEGPNLSS